MQFISDRAGWLLIQTKPFILQMRKIDPRRENWVAHFIQQLCNESISIGVSAGTALSKNKIWSKSDFQHIPSFHDYSNQLTYFWYSLFPSTPDLLHAVLAWRAGPTHCPFTLRNQQAQIKSSSLWPRNWQGRGKERRLVFWERLVYHLALGYCWILSWLSADILSMPASSSPTETNYFVLLPGPRLLQQSSALIPSPSGPRAPVCVWSLRIIAFQNHMESHNLYEHTLFSRAFSCLTAAPCHFTEAEQASWWVTGAPNKSLVSHS